MFEGETRVVYYVRWELSTVKRFALAFGDFLVPANALDPGDEIFEGLGQITEIPPLTSLINGTADFGEFVLSGVSEEILALAASEARAQAVKDKRITVGVMEYDSGWQPLDDGVQWIWTGWSDFASVLNRSQSDGNRVRQVMLRVSSLFTRRRRADFHYWTKQETKRRSPTDKFWDRTPLLQRGINLPWPRFQD